MAEQLDKLRDFLERLSEHGVWYTLHYVRYGAVTVISYSPIGYWHFDFFPDGSVNVEIYRSDGVVHGEDKLEDFFETWRDDSI